MVGKDQREMTIIDSLIKSAVAEIGDRRPAIHEVPQSSGVCWRLLIGIVILVNALIACDRGSRPTVDGSSGRLFADSIERLSHEASSEDRARLAVAMALAVRMAESPELEHLDSMELRGYSGLALEDFLGRVWANRLLAVSALQHITAGGANADVASKMGKASLERAASLLGFLDSPSCLKVVRNDLR